MKIKIIGICALIGIIFSSCGSIFDVATTSRFSDGSVSLGISKDDFIAKYGKPFQFNFFHDEDGTLNEELIYKEKIFYEYDWHMINTLFIFEDGELVSQEQIEDMDYQYRKQMEEHREALEKGGN